MIEDLADRGDDAGHREGAADFLRSPVEARLGPQAEHELDAVEGAAGEEASPASAAPMTGLVSAVLSTAQRLGWWPMRRWRPRLSFRKAKRPIAQIAERLDAIEQRDAKAGMAGGGIGEQSAERRPDDEAEIVRGAQPRHLAGALVRRRHVGDVALDHRAVAARHAAEQPHEERDIDVGREGERQIAQAVAASPC